MERWVSLETMELETINKLYLELSQVATATTEKEFKLRAALVRIDREFNELNGQECTRGCGECIRCIAREALHGA